jgi:hypothetical protein
MRIKSKTYSRWIDNSDNREAVWLVLTSVLTIMVIWMVLWPLVSG